MSKRAISLVISALIWLGTAPPAHAAGREAEVRAVVQSFYDWYTAITEQRESSIDTALHERPGLFGAELYRALEADRRAQAASPGEIVGLDFDPFSASQDPCKRYTAKETIEYGGVYRVNVYANCAGTEGEMLEIIAVVAWTDRRWQFTNFEYPEDGNLLEMLKQAAESRAPAP